VNVDLIQRVVAALEHEQVRYTIFGAVALALHGLPRATEDLDLFMLDAPRLDMHPVIAPKCLSPVKWIWGNVGVWISS